MVKIPSSPSCCQCRVRKNGCSRTKPSCTICTARGYKCLYPKVPGGFKRLPNGEFVLIDLNDPNEISFGEYEKQQRMLRMENKPVDDKYLNLPIPKEPVKSVVEVEENVVKGEDTSSKTNSYKVANLMNSDDSYHKSFNEMIKLNHSKLLDYCIKLQEYLKYFENEIFVNEKISVFTNLKSVPVYNDLYDILYNNKYDKSISLEGDEVIIKKQVNELKKRLQFLTAELENKYNIKTVENEKITSFNKDGKADNGPIENFDDDLFGDSMKFTLWGKDDIPADLYSLKTLSDVSLEINNLKEKLFKQFADIEPENGDEETIKDNQFKKVSWDEALPVLEAFSTYFLSTNIIPKSLFKIYDSESYKENSTKLSELNMMKEEAGQKRKANVDNIDVLTTSKLDNLLLLEYNIILILTLNLVDSNNMSKKILGANSYLALMNFKTKYKSMVENNIKQLFTWGIMFNRLENVSELKILYQLTLSLQEPLDYSWDLINSESRELMDFQCSIIKSQENFKGKKSYVRMNDYDNRLTNQLLMNDNLTTTKIDYILKEFYDQQEYSKFKSIDDYYVNLIDMIFDTKDIISKIDAFLNYTHYKLFWDYYKFENLLQYFDKFDEQITTKPELETLCKTILFSFTQLIEMHSLKNIEMCIGLLNEKIVKVYEAIVTMLFSIATADSKLVHGILNGIKKYLVRTESNSSISLKSGPGLELLCLLNIYLCELKSRDDTLDDGKNTYKSILKDMDTILQNALTHPNDSEVDIELEKDMEKIDGDTFKNISSLF